MVDDNTVERREPTDDDIYNRPGVEGGIAYDPVDEPGSLFDDWDSAHEFAEWFSSPEQTAAAHELNMGAYPDPRHYSDTQLCQLQTVWSEQRARPQEEVLF